MKRKYERTNERTNPSINSISSMYIHIEYFCLVVIVTRFQKYFIFVNERMKEREIKFELTMNKSNRNSNMRKPKFSNRNRSVIFFFLISSVRNRNI